MGWAYLVFIKRPTFCQKCAISYCYYNFTYFVIKKNVWPRVFWKFNELGCGIIQMKCVSKLGTKYHKKYAIYYHFQVGFFNFTVILNGGHPW